MTSQVIHPTSFIEQASGCLEGNNLVSSTKTLGELVNVFADEKARAAMAQDQVVYRVQMHAKVPDGTPGGLFFGTSFLSPGKVGNEYFMTRGHFHSRRETAEYYWCIQGEGLLLLMNEEGETWAETLIPGSLHYIPGHVAHRLVNTGDTELIVGACWPSDAGHDYATIETTGFGARIICSDGQPQLLGKAKL